LFSHSLCRAADQTELRKLEFFGVSTTTGSIENYAWNIVTGVSAGSINTSAVAMFKPDDSTMTQFLSDTWVSLSNRDVWALWPEGTIPAFTNEAGLLDN